MLVLFASLKAGLAPSADLGLGVAAWTAVKMTSTGSEDIRAGDLQGRHWLIHQQNVSFILSWR